MKTKIVLWLFVCGVALVVSAVSGISSIAASQDKMVIGHYSGMLARMLAAALGAGLCVVAECIRRKHIWGWRLFFAVQILSWILVVMGATLSVASGYKVQSTRDNILMAVIVAAASGPVVFYWCRRWYKERNHFDSNK